MARRILVTAGASGIGLEFVRAFAALGDKVFVCDINAQALDDLTKEIPGVITKVCDVSKREDIEQMVAYGAEQMGGYDILINNAGIAGPTAPLDELDPGSLGRCDADRPQRNF